MNGKLAKQLRKTAKSIYDAPVSYDDINFSVEPKIVDKAGIEHPNPSYFMNGMLARRILKDGTTRKMYLDLKKGVTAKMVDQEPTAPTFYRCRKIRKQYSL